MKRFVPQWKKEYDWRKEAYSLSDVELEQFEQNPELGTYFDEFIAGFGKNKFSADDYRKLARWVLNEAQAQFKARNESPLHSKLTPAILTKIIGKVISNELNNNTAKELIERMPDETKTVDEIIAAEGLAKVTDTNFVETVVAEVLANSVKQIEEYRSGKTKVFEFLLGQVMKVSRGKADPDAARKILKSALDG